MNPLHLLATLSLLAFVSAAAEQAAQPRTFTHRITGLFSPDRESDLRAALGKIPDLKLIRVDFTHAEAVLIYDPAVAFKGTKPEKIVDRFNELLRNATRQTMGVAAPDPTPKDKLTRIEIPVAGLDCQACCLAAYESICKLEGVAAATASFKEGRITALVDTNKTGRAALEAALKKRGVAMAKP